MKKIFLTSLFAAFSLFSWGFQAEAAALNWNNGASNMQWDTTSANWTGSVWDNVTPASATFGTTGVGTISLTTPITTAGLTFNTTGYTIASNTLTLSGTPTITTTATATISSILAGTGFTKAGVGALTLSGVNTYTGNTTIGAGTLAYTTNNSGVKGLYFGATAGNATVSALDLTAANLTATSLTVWTNSTNTNIITIGSGKTLTTNGAVTIGPGINVANSNTKLLVTGAGTWNVVNSGGTFQVGKAAGSGGYGSSGNAGVLDLSGLDTFNANLGTAGAFRVGDIAGDSPSTLSSTAILAATSTITAGTLYIGDGSSLAGTQSLKLGSGAQVLNVNSIYVGPRVTVGRSPGILSFNGSSGTLKMRAKDGINRTALNMQVGSFTTGNLLSSLFDVTGHSADLLFSTVELETNAAISNNHTSTFSFDYGNLDITTLKIGTRLAGSITNTPVATMNIGSVNNYINTATLGAVNMATMSGTAGGIVGNLNIAGSNTSVNITSLTVANDTDATGGTATGTVSISGGTTTVTSGITLAARTSAGTVNGTLSLTGGTLTVGGDITTTGSGGTVNTTLTLNGGTLDMGSYAIGGTSQLITNLNFQSGSLKNISEINTGAGLTKTTTGTLTLSGVNTYTGPTTIQGGGILKVIDNGNINPSTGATLIVGNSSIGTFQYDSNATSKFGAIAVGDGNGSSGSTLYQTAGTINATSLTLNNTYTGGGTGNVTLSGGTMTISGATIISNAVAFDNLLSTFTLSGASTVFNANGDLRLTGAPSTGRFADGKFIQNGGAVNIAGANGLLLVQGITGNTSIRRGRYDLNGGMLNVNGITNTSTGASDAVAIFNFNGGTLKPTASSSTFWINNAQTTANVQNGGAIIDTNGLDITIGQNLSASTGGGLTKTGAGALTLSGTNTYTGTTTVNGGILNFSTAVPASNNWNISHASSSTYGQLLLPASPDLTGKTINIQSSATDLGYTNTLVSWTGTAAGSNPTLQLNGVTVTSDVYVGDTKITYSATNGITITRAPSITVPTSPISLTATSNENTVSSLSWTTPSSDGGSPILSYYITNNFGISTTTVSAPATNATISNLTNGSSYTFSIVAVNAVGTSTVTTSNTVIPATVPTAPQSVMANSNEDSHSSILWSAPVSTGGSSILYYTVTSNPENISTTTTNTTAIVTGLTNGTPYTFDVTATNAVGTSTVATSNAVTPGTITDAPTSPSVVRGNQEVTVSWNPPTVITSPIIQYNVYDQSTNTIIATTSDTVTTNTFTGLTNGTTYYYYVTAVNGVGESASSSVVSGIPATYPSIPSSLGTTFGNQSISLAWTASTANGSSISQYNIYNASTSGLLATTTSTNLDFNGLTNGISYSYYVTAMNGVGESASSSIVSEVPRTLPSTPIITSVTSSSGRANISYLASSDNGSFITAYTVTSNPGNVSISGLTNPLTIIGLTNGTAYTFTVTATNAMGTSAPSATSSSVTPRGSHRIVIPQTPVVTAPEPIINPAPVIVTGGSGSLTPTTTPIVIEPVVPGGQATTTPIANGNYQPVVCTPYLTGYIKQGSKNNLEDVKKLQIFLNTYEGTTLVVDGVYKTVDMNAVKAFQIKNRKDVLDFWNMKNPSGYVYISTQKAINRVYCEHTKELKCPYFNPTTARTNPAPAEVIKIRKFLNETQNENISTTNIVFDTELVNAVKRFQVKYADHILKPWNLTKPTGLWYQSTRKYADEQLGCFYPMRLDNGVVVE